MKTDKRIALGAYDQDNVSCAHNKRFIDTTTQDCWSLASLYDQSMQIEFIEEEFLSDIESSEELFLWATQVVCESPVAMALLDNAIAQGWSLTLEETGAENHVLYIEDREIVLDKNSLEVSAIAKSSYFRNHFLINFISALRDIWHETNIGEMIFDYSPEDILMLERVKAADIMTTTVHICWELRSAGYSDIWRYMLGSQHGDMAMVFSRRLEREALSLFNGQALSDTFHNWFENEARVNPCDHDTLEMIDEYLQEGNALSVSKKMNAGFIETLTRLSNGVCYLEGRGKDILQSPHFAGCQNEINQTHLFHIMYDMNVHRVCGVPFSDPELAKKIFPTEF